MKDRSIKELLEVLLDNIHLLKDGLCLLAIDVMTYNEKRIFKKYIFENRPFNIYTLFRLNKSKYVYYWIKGKKAPRIKWLKKHIKLNS